MQRIALEDGELEVLKGLLDAPPLGPNGQPMSLTIKLLRERIDVANRLKGVADDAPFVDVEKAEAQALHAALVSTGFAAVKDPEALLALEDRIKAASEGDADAPE